MYVHVFLRLILLQKTKTMKHTFVSLIVLALLASCGEIPKADNTLATTEQTAANESGASFSVDTAVSKVSWTGIKPTGQHTGTIRLTSGNFNVEDGTIKAGSFILNTAELTDDDLTEPDKSKLEGHLKSPDFFDVATFPAAKFEITKVEAYDSAKGVSQLAGATHVISGNLTLKDSTKNISFPAKVSITDNSLSAEAKFNIDRTAWGLNYKGANNPQDWFIKKEVGLTLNISAKK